MKEKILQNDNIHEWKAKLEDAATSFESLPRLASQEEYESGEASVVPTCYQVREDVIASKTRMFDDMTSVNIALDSPGSSGIIYPEASPEKPGYMPGTDLAKAFYGLDDTNNTYKFFEYNELDTIIAKQSLYNNFSNADFENMNPNTKALLASFSFPDPSANLTNGKIINITDQFPIVFGSYPSHMSTWQAPQNGFVQFWLKPNSTVPQWIGANIAADPRQEPPVDSYSYLLDIKNFSFFEVFVLPICKGQYARIWCGWNEYTFLQKSAHFFPVDDL